MTKLYKDTFLMKVYFIKKCTTKEIKLSTDTKAHLSSIISFDNKT